MNMDQIKQKQGIEIGNACNARKRDKLRERKGEKTAGVGSGKIQRFYGSRKYGL
jgi:hypothetical protein